jgi:hypothetical protein
VNDETSVFICHGGGYDSITPEARAELKQFAEYLKDKARRKREGLPRITFDDWRAARSQRVEAEK